jgi:hypothetical protein
MTEHHDDGSPDTGGPSSSSDAYASPADPYAPPPPGWRPPPPNPMPPPPTSGWQPGPQPPAQWAPQPPPYAAPPGWQPPPPPYAAAGYPGYPSPGTWQPAGGGGTSGPGVSGGWQPTDAASGGPLPYGWTPPYPQPRATNGFCIASFVLAIPPVCLFTAGLGSLLGVIFGIVGLRQAGREGSGGRGLAIAGIVMGAIGLVIGVAILIAAVVDASHGSGGGSGGGTANTVSAAGRVPG